MQETYESVGAALHAWTTDVPVAALHPADSPNGRTMRPCEEKSDRHEQIDGTKARFGRM
jgi:hypothetical protein